MNLLNKTSLFSKGQYDSIGCNSYLSFLNISSFFSNGVGLSKKKKFAGRPCIEKKTGFFAGCAIRGEGGIWLSNLFTPASSFLFTGTSEHLTSLPLTGTILRRTSILQKGFVVFFYAIVPGNDIIMKCLIMKESS